MSDIDLEALLTQLSDEAPCGPDLAYDPAYVGLETLVQGTPERQMGDEVIAAEEPNWNEVRDASLELLSRTKDLRVVMYLTVALMKTQGLVGLNEGLSLLRGMLDKFWDHVHPELDAEDNNDPTERVNIVDSIARPPGTDGDPLKFQQRLRELYLCESRQLGRFGLRDILIARGEIPVSADPDSPPPNSDTIDAAFMDTDLGELEQGAQAVAGAIENVEAVENGLTERLGAGSAPNLSSFVSALKEVQKIVAEFLAKRGVGDGSVEGEEGEEGEEGGGGGAGAPAISGQVQSRQDVVNVLDKVCRYYEQAEPSSPVPLLLIRAKRLVAKSFIEIIQDMTPDGLRQVETISGVDNNQ